MSKEEFKKRYYRARLDAGYTEGEAIDYAFEKWDEYEAAADDYADMKREEQRARYWS